MDADTAMNGPPPPPPIIPPFSPRKGVRTVPSAKLTPLFDASISPPSCELLVRGVNANNKHADVLVAVESAIDDIQKTDNILRLVDFKLRKFGRGRDVDTWYASCYVTLGRKHNPTALEGPESEPRVDLLDRLKSALGSARPDWEVVWTPNAPGTDKRMWVRFPDVNGKPGSPGTSQEDSHGKILEWAKTKKIIVCKSFTGPSGVTLVLADPKEVDKLISRRTLSIKGIDQLLVVARTRQMEIDNPYDLVIKNVPPNYYVRQAIEHWFTNQFIDSDGDSLMDVFRAPEDDAEPDCVFVSMLTWAATVKVLGSEMQALFHSEFAASIDGQNMTLPMSVLAANQIKFTASRSERAAEKVQMALAKTEGSAQNAMECMQSEIRKLKNEFRGELKSLNNKIDDNHSVVTERIGTVENVMVQLSRSQLAMQFQNQASKEESRLRNELAVVRSAWLFEPDRAVKAEFKIEMKKLELMVEEASRKTEAREADALLLMGGCAPPSIPPPSEHANSQSLPGNTPGPVPQLSSEPIPSPYVGSSVSAPIIHPPASSTASGAVKRTFSEREREDANTTESGVWASQHAPHRGNQDTDPDDEMHDVERNLRIEAAASASTASTSTTAFTMYAVNTNGFTGPMKISQFNNVVRGRSPTAFVVSETKTKSKLSNSLPFNEYEIFEEPGEPSNGFWTFKWGMVLGVRRDIQISQRLQLTQKALRGRVIAVDVILKTSDGHAFTHRIFGVYAPWNPGSSSDDGKFWPELTNLVQSTTTSWSLAGDLNATVTSNERAGGGEEARRLFTRFLEAVNGRDIWSEIPDRNRLRDWTCKARKDGAQSGNIIDRVVSSSVTLLDADIYTADRTSDFIEGTDHRAVVADLLYAAPTPQSTTGSSRLGHSLRVMNQVLRIRIPFKKDKHKYQEFRDRVDQRIMENSTSTHAVTDDESFLNRYQTLTSILLTESEAVFGRSTPFKKRTPKVSNSKILNIVSLLKNIGGAIRYEASDRCAPISPLALTEHTRQLSHYQSLNGDNAQESTFLNYLRKVRHRLQKERYSEEAREITLQASQEDRKKITAALNGGSTKRLFSSAYVPLPLVVNDLENPDKLIADPEGVKEATRKYFQQLYDHNDTVDMPTPWLTTPSVLEVKQRVLEDPFEWPRKATLQDFRAMLRRGNARPSPGPDGWEKWVVKSLSDNALQLVLDLHNYVVMNCTFPGNVKDMWLTAFHKRGIHTQLGNWRGLLISNFIANTPMSWLNYSLIDYASRKQILPNTQVAAQPGVQTRDLMSFLAGVKSWAHRNDETVIAIKRDQKKGFDFLAPQGFHDSITAYGLPKAISDLDCAAQTNTRCFIRTAYGTTNPITVSGVTKQGGPLSPLKSTFTTSLGHYYLRDLTMNDPDALIITSQSHRSGDPHTPGAATSLNVAMVEATDDSMIFMRSLPALSRITLEMERFQFKYGWTTNWAKTVVYLLNGKGTALAASTKVTMQSVSTDRGVDPMIVEEHDVPLIHGDIEFLRTHVDDPKARFAELTAIVENFQFPRTIKRPPLTLVRKIISQNIISRIRALLYLQPIRHNDAVHIDSMIMGRVHDIMGFPFRPSPDIATLPLALRGFDFPSVARLNQGIAVTGLVRDLNHHIPAYRSMAMVTLADWTCSKNACMSPLDGLGLKKNFSYQSKSIPAAWIIAHKALAAMQPAVAIRNTDQSYLLHGDVSIAHVLNACNHVNPQIRKTFTGHSLNALHRRGLMKIHDVGKWIVSPENGEIKLSLFDLPSRQLANTWTKLSDAFALVSLDSAVQGSIELAVDPEVRRRTAEACIRAYANISPFKPSEEGEIGKWATDGSMVPAAVGITQKKSILAAATGPQTLVLRVLGKNRSILQGEQMGLISALVLSQSQVGRSTIYTDHLNSVRLILDTKTLIDQRPRLRHMNGRSYYRWMIDLSNRAAVEITYTRGHVDDDVLESRMNNEADHYASCTQSIANTIPSAPEPTFFMDSYTLYREGDGFIESNISHFVETYLAQTSAKDLRLKHHSRLDMDGIDRTPPPPYPYLRAVSAHSAAVQLYARSGQLATADILYERGKAEDAYCTLGCHDIGSAHHLFVKCGIYQAWRDDLSRKLEVDTRRRMSDLNTEIGDDVKDEVTELAKCLLSDNNRWPLNESRFYLGMHPDLSTIITPAVVPNCIRRQRIITTVSWDWHLKMIHLAGRIFGDYQKRMAVANGCRKRSR